MKLTSSNRLLIILLYLFVNSVVSYSCTSSKEEEHINRDIADSKQRLVQEKQKVKDLEEERLDLMKAIADKDLEAKRLAESRTALSGTLTQRRTQKDVAQDALADAKSWKALRSQTEREEQISKASNELHQAEAHILEAEEDLAQVKRSILEINAQKFVLQSSLDKVETDLQNARNMLPIFEKRISDLETELNKK